MVRTCGENATEEGAGRPPAWAQSFRAVAVAVGLLAARSRALPQVDPVLALDDARSADRGAVSGAVERTSDSPRIEVPSTEGTSAAVEGEPDTDSARSALESRAWSGAPPQAASRVAVRNGGGQGAGGVRAELAGLAEELEKGRPGERRVAVRALAALNSPPAWELVIGALLDPESEVADTAQLELRALRDARLQAELLGPRGLRARERQLALRVAQTVGRMEVELDGELLVARATQAEPEVARLLLGSIERLQASKHLGGEPAAIVEALDRLVRSHREASTRAAALSALGRLDYFLARERVLEALDERDPGLRCAALSVAGGYVESECLAISARGLADREPRVRCQALENLEGLASRAALTAIADHLGIERSERLRWRMLAFLQARSGQDHGFDPAAWRAWAGTVSSAVVTGEARAWTSGDTQVVFAGLPMLSERSAFLIDFSGSMWQTKIGERTRKEIVDAHLRGVLQALPPEARFNVIPFTNEPIPWEERLVPASRANVARAVDWFERARQSGRGNFYDAARLALADPEVDTIVVLTDGVPTGGRHSNLELVVELLYEENRFRKVAFDAVLVDAPAGRKRLWEDLARGSGGRTVSVGLEDLARAK